MKNLPQLLTIILITSLPFLSNAQFSIGILTAPISSVTTTKILVPIGVELKFLSTMSIVLEYGIPVFDIKEYEYNETTASYSAEFRSYKPTIDKKGFQRYYAVNLIHTPETYTLENDRYSIEADQKIIFDYAEISTTINSISINIGAQKTFKSKITLDFNFGFRLNNKSVAYENVIIASPPYSKTRPRYLNLVSYDFIPAFSPQPDDIAISHYYMNLLASIRVGYLFSR